MLSGPLQLGTDRAGDIMWGPTSMTFSAMLMTLTLIIDMANGEPLGFGGGESDHLMWALRSVGFLGEISDTPWKQLNTSPWRSDERIKVESSENIFGAGVNLRLFGQQKGRHWRTCVSKWHSRLALGDVVLAWTGEVGAVSLGTERGQVHGIPISLKARYQDLKKAMGGEKHYFQASGPTGAGAHEFGESVQASGGRVEWTLELPQGTWSLVSHDLPGHRGRSSVFQHEIP